MINIKHIGAAYTLYLVCEATRKVQDATVLCKMTHFQ